MNDVRVIDGETSCREKRKTHRLCASILSGDCFAEMMSGTQMVEVEKPIWASTRSEPVTVRKTKGRRCRTIPIHSQLQKILENLKSHVDGRLFHGPRGGKLKPDTARNGLVRDVIEPLKARFPTPEAEIGLQHGRVHSFRHFFVSQAFLGGASEGEVKEWIGHQDSKMVAHYRHLHDEDSQRRMQQIDFFGSNNPVDGPQG